MRAENQVRQQAGRRNLVQMLVDRAADKAAVGGTTKRNGAWVDVRWSEILAEVQKLSAAIVGLGVKPGDRVAVFAGTGLQWVITDLAISAARAITVPIYGSNTPDEARYILQNSEASLLFVDNDEKDGKQQGRLSRARARIGECPSVKTVVVFEGAAGGDREMTLADLMRQGEQAHATNPKAFDERLAQIQDDDACLFIYTSGTTGDPKGVILTHGNFAYEAVEVGNIGLMEPGDSVMLFLPLAHVFAQVIKAAWLGQGFRMIFAESIDKLMGNLIETRPTVLPSVPRVFEKVYNGVVANGSSAPGLKGKMFRWAMGLFDEYVEARQAGREYSSLSFALAKKLVFSKVRETLFEKVGGNMRLFISGGAPLSRKIAYFFDVLGLKVLEGYGLTETCAATTVNRVSKYKIGTVGPAMPGTELKIATDGEILIRGPGVMKGYYKNDAATAEVLEADGWFHSGDIGEIDPEGFLRITDRKKDIIVTAGGKNVAPQNIENQLKTFPLISQAMVYGDKRKYLTVLITVNEETGRKLLAEKGVKADSYAALAKHPDVSAAVQKVIDEVNASQPPYNTLKRFSIMDHDFTQESGELTPTLKVKRKFCTQKYKAVLDGLYDGEVVD